MSWETESCPQAAVTYWVRIDFTHPPLPWVLKSRGMELRSILGDVNEQRGQSDSLGIEDHEEISSIENYYEKISEKTIEITPRHRTSHLMTFNTNSVSNKHGMEFRKIDLTERMENRQQDKIESRALRRIEYSTRTTI